MLNRVRQYLTRPKVLALIVVVLLFAIPLLYTAQPLIGPVPRRPAPTVDVAQLQADVTYLASASRIYSDRSGLDAVAAWIHGRFEACGARVQDQVYGVQGKAYRNVVADFDLRKVRCCWSALITTPATRNLARTTTRAASRVCWRWRSCSRSILHSIPWNWWPTLWKSHPSSAARTWAACAMLRR